MTEEEIGQKYFETGCTTNEPTQSWLVVNLDKRQYQWTYRITETLGIFWDCKFYGDPYPYHIYVPFDAIDLLTRHQLDWPRRDIKKEVNLKRGYSPCFKKSELFCFPPEINMRLFKFLDCIDALCLAHTCRYFWALGHNYFERVVENVLSPWIGDRIVCIGSKTTEFPPVEVPQDITTSLSKDEASVYNYIEDNFTEVFPQITPWQFESFWSTRSRQILSCLQELINKNASEMSEGRIKQLYLSFFTPRRGEKNCDLGIYALRNLDTKEFIILRGISMTPFEVFSNHSKGEICLLSVLLYKTTWSTVDDTDSNYRGLHQGPWVGHRFDVTTVDRIFSDNQFNWKDLTGQARQELGSIALSDNKSWAEKYQNHELDDYNLEADLRHLRLGNHVQNGGVHIN